MNKNIVVIGASADGLKIIIQVLKELPSNINASIFIVIHNSAQSKPQLDEILKRETNIPIRYVTAKEIISRHKTSTLLAAQDLERIERGAPIDSAQGETFLARNLAGRDPGTGSPCF